MKHRFYLQTGSTVIGGFLTLGVCAQPTARLAGGDVFARNDARGTRVVLKKREMGVCQSSGQLCGR